MTGRATGRRDAAGRTGGLARPAARLAAHPAGGGRARGPGRGAPRHPGAGAIALLAALVALAPLAAGCAARRAASGGERLVAGASPAPVDSAALLVWRFDETGGARVADAGPLRMEGTAGIDTRTDFGRIRGARLFTESLESFAYAPYRPALDPLAGMTVEAWVQPSDYGAFELSAIAGRWTAQPSEQSWLFGIVGRGLTPVVTGRPSPGLFASYVVGATVGRLVFLLQPADAGPARAYYSTTPVELNRWTHVAASFDGQVVRFFLDGLPDAQHAATGRVRESRAPLLVGNVFDWRALSDFGGELRVEGTLDRTPYYAFEGYVDDLRLSTVGRTDFPHARYAAAR